MVNFAPFQHFHKSYISMSISHDFQPVKQRYMRAIIQVTPLMIASSSCSVVTSLILGISTTRPELNWRISLSTARILSWLVPWVRWLGSCLVSCMVGWLMLAGWLILADRTFPLSLNLFLPSCAWWALRHINSLELPLDMWYQTRTSQAWAQIGIPHLNHGPCNYWYLSPVVKLAMFLFWYEHVAVVWVSSCRL